MMSSGRKPLRGICLSPSKPFQALTSAWTDSAGEGHVSEADVVGCTLGPEEIDLRECLRYRAHVHAVRLYEGGDAGLFRASYEFIEEWLVGIDGVHRRAEFLGE